MANDDKQNFGVSDDALRALCSLVANHGFAKGDEHDYWAELLCRQGLCGSATPRIHSTRCGIEAIALAG